MAESNQIEKKEDEKKLLVVITSIGWLFYVGMFVGRAIGIIATHDDVAGVGDFFSRLGTLSDLGFLIFLVAITITVILNKKKANRG